MANHPKAGPLALMVGTPGLHGPENPVTNISSVLWNKDRVKKERQKFTKRSSQRGGIAKLVEYCNTHKGWVVQSIVSKIAVISMQTKLICAQLIKDSTISTEPVNGLVSDAAHGFWRERNDLLIITSCYAPDLNCWVSGLMSYLNGASAEHYEAHFFALFRTIVQQVLTQNIKMEDRLFSGVRLYT